MMKKLVTALLCLPLVGLAQTVTNHAVATQFNQWRAPGQVNLVAGANTFVTIAPCTLTAGNVNFYAVSLLTPVKINDPGNTAIDEIVTPTAVVSGGNCTATLTTSNAHPTPWYLTSGTYGLQEAINAGAQSSVLNVVDVSPSWHQAGGGAQNWYSANGNANLAISDGSIAPPATFKWSGTHYVSNYSINGTSATIAAGAAAGTAPTVSNNGGGSGNVITANVTTGTATTTGTLFTETVTTSGSNLNCTIQSVGANNFPSVISYTASSPTVATFTVAAAPPVSTAYVFNILCE